MKFIIGVVAMLLPLLSMAQSPPIKPLNIGDTVPDITITHVYNYPDSVIRLSDLKGKLVILDFWETYCSSCMEALLKFDNIQKKFGNKIQVITFARYGAGDHILTRLQRIRKLKNIDLPIAINNEKAYQYFPHQLISHVIWIDKEGIIRGITGSDYASPENAALLLAGNKINWAVKKDVAAYDYTRPLMTLSNKVINQPSQLFYSSFMNYLDGVAPTHKIIRDTVSNSISINDFNVTLSQMGHAVIAGHCGTINLKRAILNVRDTSKYFHNNLKSYYSDWARENTYCYSVCLPLNTSPDKIREFIKDDAARWLNIRFGLSVKYEKVKVNCWILKNGMPDTDLLNSTSAVFVNDLNDNESSVKKMKKAPFGNLIWMLNNEIPAIPFVVDETNIPKRLKVDMDLHFKSLNSLQDLNSELKKYGLSLIPGQRELDMYVFTEVN